MHVDINDKPRHSPGKDGIGSGKGLFRRRVVFELDAEQLPVLEAAERRHGTKREALIAALAAEASAAEVAERADRAEKALAKAERSAKGSSAKQKESATKLERELAAARRKLAVREQELAQLRTGAGRPRRSSTASWNASKRQSKSLRTRPKSSPSERSIGSSAIAARSGFPLRNGTGKRRRTAEAMPTTTHAASTVRHPGQLQLAGSARQLSQSEPPKRSFGAARADLRSLRWRGRPTSGNGGKRSPAPSAVRFASGRFAIQPWARRSGMANCMQ